MNKTKLMFLICVLPLIGAEEPAGYKYWSAAELKGFAKTLAPKMNAQKFVGQRLTEFGNHYTMVAHREGNGEAELHETESDLFVVTSGTATLIVGGTLQRRQNHCAGRDSRTVDRGRRRSRSSPPAIWCTFRRRPRTSLCWSRGRSSLIL